VPTLGVNVAIIQDGRILLTKRRDVPVWCLPGGGVEAGESVAEAAVREAFEETGLGIELTRLVGVYSRPDWRLEGDHVILFAARPVAGHLHEASEETTEARFFAADELPEQLLWWHHQRICDALSDGPAVAWSQQAQWPFGSLAPPQVSDLLAQRGISEQEIFRQLCGPSRPDRETLQVGGSRRNQDSTTQS
jgi:8-oxo-dGTP diphosphatase